MDLFTDLKYQKKMFFYKDEIKYVYKNICCSLKTNGLLDILLRDVEGFCCQTQWAIGDKRQLADKPQKLFIFTGVKNQKMLPVKCNADKTFVMI